MAGEALRPQAEGVELVHQTPGQKIRELLDQTEALSHKDYDGPVVVTGKYKTFEDIIEAANRGSWNPRQISRERDAQSYAKLSRQGKKAWNGVWGTLKRAESEVAELLPLIVNSIPPDPQYDGLRMSLGIQALEEYRHDDSIGLGGTEVIGIKGGPEALNKKAKRYNNFVAEKLFGYFVKVERGLLVDNPNVTIEDVYVAVLIYCIAAEDWLAQGDKLLRAKNNKFDQFEEPRESSAGSVSQLLRRLFKKDDLVLISQLTAYGAVDEEALEEESVSLEELATDQIDFPGSRMGQILTGKDEGRHVANGVIATADYLNNFETARPRILAVVTDMMDLADRMLGEAKKRSWLIDGYLKKGYGDDVDSLYYYCFLMARCARRLSAFNLKEGVIDIHNRMSRAVELYTDENGEPIIEQPTIAAKARTIGDLLLHRAKLVLPQREEQDLAKAA